MSKQGSKFSVKVGGDDVARPEKATRQFAASGCPESPQREPAQQRDKEEQDSMSEFITYEDTPFAEYLKCISDPFLSLLYPTNVVVPLLSFFPMLI